MDLQINVLGTVEVLRAGKSVALGGARQRALLALLSLQPGRAIETTRIIDELWQGDPPEGAQTTLRSYISRLRKALGASVTAAPGGYVLDIPAGVIDATRFAASVEEGDEALSKRRSRRAAERFDEALSLWRGRPFGGSGETGWLRVEAERLEELRWRALEGRNDAYLGLGRASVLVQEIEALLSGQPYRERLWRQLMLALYRSERQADALAAYQRARAALVEGLGLEPSEEIVLLQELILRHEVPHVVEEATTRLPVPTTGSLAVRSSSTTS